jgi:Transposase DDE domain.
MYSPAQEWRIFVENRAAVIAALERGEVDGMLPAARGFLDGFAEFLLENQVMQTLAEFKDPRARRNIPMVFFCTALVYKPLFQLRSLGQIGSVLFRSPYILRQLGFNARQLEHGFYETPEAQRPFDPEAIAECFADVKASALFKHQQQMLQVLAQRFPAQLREGLWVMDSVHFQIPRGNRTPARQFKACILGVYQGSVVWPMLWQCVSPDVAEVTVGQTVLAAALKVLPKGVLRHLLVDRGYIDGDWLSRLYRRHGVQVTIGVRENMQAYDDLIGLTRLPQTQWETIPPPDNHRDPAPERAVTYIETVTSWDRCSVPLAGCVIRDTYPDQVNYQVLVMTLPRQPAVAVTAKAIYRGRAQRWTLEEVFMALTRYWHFDALYPCRLGVGRAIAHFSLLAFTLLGLYYQESDEADNLHSLNAGPPPLPLPERELAVYCGPYFALLRTSQIVEIILNHAPVWTNRRADILQALTRFEGSP